MLDRLLPLLPREMGSFTLILVALIAAVGLVLWLGGARFSRGLITLLTVTLGAAIGLQLPRWLNWPINGWSTSIGGAVVLGVSGYAWQRFWVGMALALVLVCWTALGTWALWSDNIAWVWPAYEPSTGLAAYVRSLWTMLPDGIHSILPIACGAAAVCGIAIALVWPRFGMASLYSLTGTLLVIATGLALVQQNRPQWLHYLPSRNTSQGLGLAVIVILGALIQFRLAPGGARPTGRATDPKNIWDEWATE